MVVGVRYKGCIVHKRPSWTDYFLGLAIVASQRSHDIHTQHGCIITDENHHLLSAGYNGFPPGMPDNELPTNRPDKYEWMIHSERNAIDNCLIKPVNGIAYVTGQCCNDCIKHLYRNGIKKVVMMKSHGTHLFDEKQQNIFDTFIKYASKNGFEIEYVEPDLSWLRQLVGVIDGVDKLSIENNKE